jgi:hypothetical protein
MNNLQKPIDPIPEEFSNEDEAAVFWDAHDTTDYLNESRPVKVVGQFRARHYEIEIDENVAQTLRLRAKRQGITPSRLASDLLRQQLAILK